MRFIHEQRESNPSFRWMPRSGGHSTAGYSTVEGGLMLDLRGLNNIFVQPQRKLAHVGPGVQMRDFYRTMHDYGLFAPGVSCPDVPIGGMMQGGGFGFGSRMFGMNCDNVTEVEMVLGDGRVVLANELHNADLFWAVRGGTGNQFGIVTRATYQLYPLQDVGAVQLQWRLGTDTEAAQGAHALDSCSGTSWAPTTTGASATCRSSSTAKLGTGPSCSCAPCTGASGACGSSCSRSWSPRRAARCCSRTWARSTG